MNMQKLFFAAITAICLTAFAACSDSDETGNEPTPATVDVNMDQRTALASVLGQLTGQEFCDTTDINFEGRTFEATIGLVRNESRPSERSIQVRTASLAEAYFRTLAGGASALVQETADGCVIDLTNLDSHSSGRKQNFGTLTFHRGEGADNVGYADVDIACIPGLQRISYKTADQWGDNGRFESPIGYGEVFLGGGLYWICVREATGNNSQLCGMLFNIQPGKGNGWEPIYEKEKWAAWRPNTYCNWDNDVAVIEYIHLCGDESFARRKRKIMAQPYGSQVFPCGKVWFWTGDYWGLGGVEGAGFGDTEHKGYCHWAQRPNSAEERGVIIVRAASEGDYYPIAWRWWRRWHICCTSVKQGDKSQRPQMNPRSYKIEDESAFISACFRYIDYEDFYKFPENALIYTSRGQTFTNSIPAGFVKVDI